jgi:hypothetical protein
MSGITLVGAFKALGPSFFGGGASALTPGFVQKFDTFNNGAGSPQSFIFPSNIGVGNTIVFKVTWSTAATISSVVDGNSTAYTNFPWASGATTCDSGTANTTRLYYLPNSSGGANPKTITITWSAAPTFVWFTGEEISGVPTTSPIDNADCIQQAVTSTPTSPSLTPASSGSYLLSFVQDINANGRTYTAGTTPAYTRDGSSGSTTQNEEHFSPSTGVAVTGNWTTSAAVDSVTSLVILKP